MALVQRWVCEDHPAYRGLRTPRIQCAACEELYYMGREKKAANDNNQEPEGQGPEVAELGSGDSAEDVQPN